MRVKTCAAGDATVMVIMRSSLLFVRCLKKALGSRGQRFLAGTNRG